MKTYGGTAPRIFNFDTRWRGVLSFISLSIEANSPSPGITRVRGWRGPQSEPGSRGERQHLYSCRESNHASSVVESVASHYTGWDTGSSSLKRKPLVVYINNLYSTGGLLFHRGREPDCHRPWGTVVAWREVTPPVLYCSVLFSAELRKLPV